MNAPTLPKPPNPADDASADLFDYQLLRDWARFVFNSFGRHRFLGIVCFLFLMGGAIGAAMFLPRKYEAHTKLLTHQTTFMAALSNPYARNPDEGPTRAARDRVLARDNLEKIVTETDLIHQWQVNRNPVLRMKDQLLQLIGGAWSDEDWMDIMVGTLEKRVTVDTGDGTVDIGVTWPDPVMARRIIEAAQQNFLETRHVSEVAAISETIGILEIHASQTQAAIDESLANLQRVIDDHTKGLRAAMPQPAPAPAPVARPKPVSDVPAQELAQLKFLLRSKQRAIADLEEFRTRQLTDLRTNLEQQRVIYNRSHPVILELEQRVEALQKDSPQLVTLKRDEADLTREIEAKGGGNANGLAETNLLPVRRTPTVMETSLAQLAPDLERDPTITVAQDQLRVALARYQELMMRVEAARLELDTARAAFKYRFSVVNPAQTPRKPISPNVPFILLAGLLGGILFAFIACAGLDLWRRTLCEPWQIERQLKLPVLSTVRL
jgi:uncharacterized protein involved in exopolysaccharide biosynthesis